MKKLIQIYLTTLMLTSSLYAELSKDQVKAIAKQYAAACVDRDFDAWKALYYSSDKCKRRDFMLGVANPNHTKGSHIKTVRIKNVKGLSVQVEPQKNMGVKSKGWLLLLPNGKIKYDPIIYPHPIIAISQECQHALAIARGVGDYDSSSDYSDSIRYLLKSGIPTFGLEAGDPTHKQIKALEEIAGWIAKNRNQWDNSEPHVYLPNK